MTGWGWGCRQVRKLSITRVEEHGHSRSVIEILRVVVLKEQVNENILAS